jgi:hypothetical protein
MTIEVDLKEIKHLLSTLKEKIDMPLEDRDGRNQYLFEAFNSSGT